MEKKGYVDHEADGKTYRYQAKVPRSRTTGLVIRDFVSRFFDGSTEALLHGPGREPGRLARDVGEAAIRDQTTSGGDR